MRGGGVGADAGDQGAEDEAEVTPEAVDAHDAGAVARLAGIRDGRDQGRVDHRRTHTEQRGGGERGIEGAAAGDEQPEGRGLDEHAADDQRLAAGVVGQPARHQLTGAPDDRIDRRDDGDLADAGAVGCQIERCEAPGECVVEVVDQPGLAAGPQDRVADACLRERRA